jgi:U32 family peptidase
VLPQLVAAGLACLKIEGRLKAPEYVASVTRVYRQALDRLGQDRLGQDRLGQDRLEQDRQDQDQYALEMAFSRGLHTGWFEGIDNQALVHGRYGKKRGVYLGEVVAVQGEQAVVELEGPLKPGDGVVFDSGRPDQPWGRPVFASGR